MHSIFCVKTFSLQQFRHISCSQLRLFGFLQSLQFSYCVFFDTAGLPLALLIIFLSIRSSFRFLRSNSLASFKATAFCSSSTPSSFIELDKSLRCCFISVVFEHDTELVIFSFSFTATWLERLRI